MVRGVLHNGIVKLIDPLPASWREGQEVELIPHDAPMDPAEIDQWEREMEQPNSGITEDDLKILLRILDEQKQEQKELMRRRMGHE